MNLLWDFDVTLFDTYPAYTSILHEVLGPAIAKEDILLRLKVSFTHAIRHFGLREDQLLRIGDMERNLSPGETPPFPGVERVLRYAGKNVIVTHKPRAEVQKILNHYGWEAYFIGYTASIWS